MLIVKTPPPPPFPGPKTKKKKDTLDSANHGQI
jgi:hypothetical protein